MVESSICWSDRETLCPGFDRQRQPQQDNEPTSGHVHRAMGQNVVFVISSMWQGV